ncbi:low molecular weight phosphotyrosine protein phosphatase [Alistipes sp. OttesenSCG-928-B03]|nr:low molecular weight phosphotyrosine protein phosphatase [Alistipes sp. OttesenSCG-928-B03]
MKKRVLFVCLGNICRSPAAEGIMRKMVADRGLADDFEVDSAGTYAGHAGELPNLRMRQPAARRGYQLTHHARHFTIHDFDRFDIILVMDDSNYDDVCCQARDLESRAKVHRMAEFITSQEVDHVPDPYYGGHEGFEHVLDLLEDGCINLIDRLSAE